MKIMKSFLLEQLREARLSHDPSMMEVPWSILRMIASFMNVSCDVVEIKDSGIETVAQIGGYARGARTYEFVCVGQVRDQSGFLHWEGHCVGVVPRGYTRGTVQPIASEPALLAGDHPAVTYITSGGRYYDHGNVECLAWEGVQGFPRCDFNAIIFSNDEVTHIRSAKSATFEAYQNEGDPLEFHCAIDAEGPTRVNFGATVALWRSQWEGVSRPVRKEEILCFNT